LRTGKNTSADGSRSGKGEDRDQKKDTDAQIPGFEKKKKGNKEIQSRGPSGTWQGGPGQG